MEKIFDVLSMKHLLLVSIALNVSLILRVIDGSEKEIPNSEKVHVSKNMQLFLSSSSSSSSSLFSSTGIEAQDGWERVINLDSYKKRGPYNEIVTSPNNPDGFIRQSVVNRSQGILVHDLAYYWPQYTSISFPANHDLMLFTVSTITGHAGMRIGWAIVKDKEVAKKMAKYIELNTFGVSRDSQLRAAKVLKVVSKSCTEPSSSSEDESFFEFSHHQLATRWKLLRLAVQKSGQFSLPEFSPQNCTFLGREFKPQPAFAWLKCEHQKVNDCESFLRSKNILTRSGKQFGFSSKYVRISMIIAITIVPIDDQLPKIQCLAKKKNWVASSMIYLSVAEIGSGVEVGDSEAGEG
ncbi:hypothetical protein LWI29_011381 [Acer saccharum]|uniref:Alliinase C-terminal domain-containing protein n=1 Tax=Acer saccharum TaxID=4024 RepID=A0AA39VQJ8_ACESA|nr:hypothetical protein LWI29_011381 [Acer saccharum]